MSETIYYGVVPNLSPRGGWLPVVFRAGRWRGDTYGIGYHLDTALEMAKAEAQDWVARNHGDRIQEGNYPEIPDGSNSSEIPNSSEGPGEGRR